MDVAQDSARTFGSMTRKNSKIRPFIQSSSEMQHGGAHRGRLKIYSELRLEALDFPVLAIFKIVGARGPEVTKGR